MRPGKKDQVFLKDAFENSTRYSEICKEFDEKGIGIFNHDIQIDSEPEDIPQKSE